MVAAVITERKGKISPVVFIKGEIKKSHHVYCSGEGTMDADATKLLESI